MFNSSLKYRSRFFVQREHRSFQLYLYSFVIFFNLIFFFFCFLYIVITTTNESKFRYCIRHNDKETRFHFFSNFQISERKQIDTNSQTFSKVILNVIPRRTSVTSLESCNNLSPNQAAGRTRHVHNNELATSRSTGYTGKQGSGEKKGWYDRERGGNKKR